MTYGFYASSSSGSLQIDSDQPYSYLKVTAKGSATNVSVSSSELLFIKPAAAAAVAYGALNTSGTYAFYNSVGTSVSLDYIKVASTKTGSPSTGYGLHIYNVDGQLAFDTGIFSTGTAGENVAQIVKIVPAVTPYISGDYSSSASIVYTGSDYLTVYANITNSVFNNVSGSYINGFKWNSSDTTIRFSSIRATPPGGYFNALFDIALVKSI